MHILYFPHLALMRRIKKISQEVNNPQVVVDIVGLKFEKNCNLNKRVYGFGEHACKSTVKNGWNDPNIMIVRKCHSNDN